MGLPVSGAPSGRVLRPMNTDEELEHLKKKQRLFELRAAVQRQECEAAAFPSPAAAAAQGPQALAQAATVLCLREAALRAASLVDCSVQEVARELRVWPGFDSVNSCFRFFSMSGPPSRIVFGLASNLSQLALAVEAVTQMVNENVGSAIYQMPELQPLVHRVTDGSALCKNSAYAAMVAKGRSELIRADQAQAELAESEAMQAKLGVTVAVRARAEEQIQADSTEAEALKMQLDEVRALRARAEEQLQAELAETQALTAQLDEAAALRARAAMQIQAELTEARAMKLQLDETAATQVIANEQAQAELAEARAQMMELAEVRAVKVELEETQFALAQAQKEASVAQDVQRDIAEATLAEAAKLSEVEVAAMEEAKQAKACVAELEVEVVAAQAGQAEKAAASKKGSRGRA